MILFPVVVHGSCLSFILIRCDVLLINHDIKPHTISSNSSQHLLMIVAVTVIIIIT
jgi:hypothetical protein